MKKLIALFLISVMIFPLYGNANNGNHKSAESEALSYVPQFGIHSDGVELIKDFDSMDEFVDSCYEKGYSIILFNALPWEYYFVSPTLNRLGWEFGEDLLSPMIERAHEKGIKVFVDIQSLAWKIREDFEDWPGNAPSTSDVVNIVSELISHGVDGISEEMFLADWFSPVYNICNENGVMYLHKGIPYDVAWFCNESSTAFEAYSNCSVLMTEDYYANDDLARNCIVPSFASSLNKPYWAKSCPEDWALGSITNMENVLLMRMVQYHPDYIFAMIYNRSDFDEFNPAFMPSLIQNYIVDEDKPVCDIVVYLTNEAGTDDSPKDFDPWQLLDVGFSAIANGIMASGYRIEITSEPMENADAYYVYTRGGWWDETNILDLPDSIVNLFYGNKTVFLEVGGVLPASTPNWKSIRSRIGIASDKTFDTIFDENHPVDGVYDGIAYTHLSDNWFLFNNIKISDVWGEILSTCSYEGNTYVLALRDGNRIFINGAGLDFNASFLISSILSDGLQSPSNCISATGLVSTFYATDDTPIHIKLPYNASSLNWTKRDMNGNVQSGNSPYDGNDGYMDYLPKGTLLILRSNGNISVSVTRPSNALYINDREIIPLNRAIIFGKIRIDVDVASDMGVKEVDFYIDGNLKYKCTGPPYQWLWDEHAVGNHEIEIKAYDSQDNKAEDALGITIFNL